MSENETIWTREAMGQEIAKFVDVDPQYTYTLVALASHKGIISPEEAAIAKRDLDERYKGRMEQANGKKGKYMVATFRKVGFIRAKVLWELIGQFPRWVYGDPERAEFIPHGEDACKRLKIPTIDYYTIVGELIDLGYLTKRTEKKHLVYGIVMDKVLSDLEEYEALKLKEANEGESMPE